MMTTPSFANVISKLTSWIVVIVSLLLAVAVTFPSVKPVGLLAGLGLFSLAVGPLTPAGNLRPKPSTRNGSP